MAKTAFPCKFYSGLQVVETADCHQSIKNQRSQSIIDVHHHRLQRGQDEDQGQGAGEGHLA